MEHPEITIVHILVNILDEVICVCLLYPGYLRCGSWASSSGITWELVRNAESQVPPQTQGIRICS